MTLCKYSIILLRLHALNKNHRKNKHFFLYIIEQKGRNYSKEKLERKKKKQNK
jgi:hypothetical protein